MEHFGHGWVLPLWSPILACESTLAPSKLPNRWIEFYWSFNTMWRTPTFLERLKCKSESENNIRIRNWGTFPNSQHFGGGRCVKASRWELGWMISRSIIHMNLHIPNNKLVSAWLEHFWCTDKPWAYWTHKTHHSPNLGEAITFPLIVFSMISHKGYIQMSFCFGTPKLRVPKFPKLGLLALWKAITFCAHLWLRWSLKKSCSLHQKLFNNMWHITYTQVFQGDYWLLMVKS
jgi:hypothetical protein